ncbi:MAG: TolC family outer membrane protein [Gammaproteobacteria bacterium]|nr:TolC family outer membrane protein [Gammaproteobacteria bacterium]
MNFPKCLATLLACSLTGVAHAGDDLLNIYLLAQQNDAGLQVAEARYQATAQGDSIALANLLPRINYEYTLGETRQSLEGNRTGSMGGRDRYTTRNERLTLSQTLYHHDLYVELDRAEANTAQALAQRDAARQKLIVRTAEAYFDVLAAQDAALFSRKEKDAIALQLEQAEARFQVGLTAIVEVKETQASYDLAVAQEIEAQNLLENQRETLTVITGHSHKDLSLLSERLRPTTPEPADIQEWTEAALEHNLDYLIQKHALTIARHSVRFEEAKHWPTLDLFVSLDDVEDTGGVFSPGGSELKADRVSVQLKVPLLAGGEVYYRTRQAIFEREAVQAELLATRREIERNTRSAYRNVTAGTSRVHAFERALESARVDLEAHEAGLEAGTRDTVDVVQATSRLYAAERDYSRARYDYIVDTLRLRQATGQLSLEDIEWANSLLD